MRRRELLASSEPKLSMKAADCSRASLYQVSMAPRPRPREEIEAEWKAVLEHLSERLHGKRIAVCLPYLPGKGRANIQAVFEPEKGAAGFGETLKDELLELINRVRAAQHAKTKLLESSDGVLGEISKLRRRAARLATRPHSSRWRTASVRRCVRTSVRCAAPTAAASIARRPLSPRRSGQQSSASRSARSRPRRCRPTAPTRHGPSPTRSRWCRSSRCRGRSSR